MEIFKQNILSLYGESGNEWLSHLDQHLNDLSQQLSIHIETPYQNLSYHYVTKAIDDKGNVCVLKLSPPNKEMQNEIKALRYFQGKGIIRLLDSNSQQGWMLLECCEPGEPLAQLTDDDTATHIAMETMQNLWRPVNSQHHFQTLKTFIAALARANTPLIPQTLLSNAKHIAEELLTSTTEPVLLHGDLHHHNILRANRCDWLAIDPKGVAGDKAFEVGALLQNPHERLAKTKDLSKLIQRRLAIITEQSGIDQKRLQSWAFVQATLAACWCIEDKVHGHEHMLRCAQTFYQFIQAKSD
jgi:streptomycin 6-kinase